MNPTEKCRTKRILTADLKDAKRLADGIWVEYGMLADNAEPTKEDEITEEDIETLNPADFEQKLREYHKKFKTVEIYRELYSITFDITFCKRRSSKMKKRLEKQIKRAERLGIFLL